MKIAFPSRCATPRPSWSRDSMTARCMVFPRRRSRNAPRTRYRESNAMRSALRPTLEKFLPVRLGRLAERRADEVALRGVLLVVERAAHQLEAQKNEVGVGDVGFAVAA